MHNQWEATHHTLHLLFIFKLADLSIKNKATPLPRERWGLCELLSMNLRNRRLFKGLILRTTLLLYNEEKPSLGCGPCLTESSVMKDAPQGAEKLISFL